MIAPFSWSQMQLRSSSHMLVLDSKFSPVLQYAPFWLFRTDWTDCELAVSDVVSLAVESAPQHHPPPSSGAHGSVQRRGIGIRGAMIGHNLPRCSGKPNVRITDPLQFGATNTVLAFPRPFPNGVHFSFLSTTATSTSPENADQLIKSRPWQLSALRHHYFSALPRRGRLCASRPPLPLPSAAWPSSRMAPSRI